MRAMIGSAAFALLTLVTIANCDKMTRAQEDSSSNSGARSNQTLLVQSPSFKQIDVPQVYPQIQKAELLMKKFVDGLQKFVGIHSFDFSAFDTHAEDLRQEFSNISFHVENVSPCKELWEKLKSTKARFMAMSDSIESLRHAANSGHKVYVWFPANNEFHAYTTPEDD